MWCWYLAGNAVRRSKRRLLYSITDIMKMEYESSEMMTGCLTLCVFVFVFVSSFVYFYFCFCFCFFLLVFAFRVCLLLFNFAVFVVCCCHVWAHDKRFEFYSNSISDRQPDSKLNRLSKYQKRLNKPNIPNEQKAMGEHHAHTHTHTPN